MKGLSGLRTARIAAAIQAYLSRHPDAADSEKGIAEFWLPAMGMQATAAEVAVALAHLEQLGAVVRQALPDGRMMYHARKA